MQLRNTKVKQRDISDCGAACLASVAAFYQLQLPVSRIRQYAGTDKKGTNVLGMIEAAEKLGFEAKGVKGTIESLSKIPKPAIAHVALKNGLHHYVVIYKATAKHVSVMDPGSGNLRKRSIEDFKSEWTGVLVLLLPNESFVKGKFKTGNAARFWKLIKPHKSILLQALIGAVVYTLLGLTTSIYVQKIVDFVLVEGNLRLLNLLSTLMVAILIFQLIIGYIKTVMALKTGQLIDARLILGYYKHLLSLPQRFFDTMRVGEIISRINDAVKIRLFINDVALSIVVNLLITAFSIAIMFLYYWKLAVIMLAIVPFYVLMYWASNKVNKKWQRKLMEESAELESGLVESLNAVGTIKRFGLEDFAGHKTESRFIRLLRSIYNTGIYNLQLGTASEATTRIFTIIILWAGSYFVINRELSPGELLSFYALIGYFTGPALSLIGASKNVQDALIAADRLFEIIDLETETNTAHSKVHLTPELIGDIRFHNVDFRYGTRTTVFQGLNLTIQKGQSTAIVGESGSGKSTLLSLLQNLYPLQNGSITIGGIDLGHINNKSLRHLICVVPQHIDLFAGTIIENIAVGEFEPDLQRILNLAHLLGINEFIEQLPANYYTMLNEQGINLSGGQRQRIAIARALYRNPEVLILDEATAALDSISEQKIQATLHQFVKQGKTLIIIAHRLSTVAHCDAIVVLQEGKVAEMGAHGELLAQKGTYHRLWQNLTLS